MRRRLRPSWFGGQEQGLSLTGPDGLLGQLPQTVLETALNEEMTEHLGYEKHDPPEAGPGNVRNGTRSKTVLTDTTGEVSWPPGSPTTGDSKPTTVAAMITENSRALILCRHEFADREFGM